MIETLFQKVMKDLGFSGDVQLKPIDIKFSIGFGCPPDYPLRLTPIPPPKSRDEAAFEKLMKGLESK